MEEQCPPTQSDAEDILDVQRPVITEDVDFPDTYIGPDGRQMIVVFVPGGNYLRLGLDDWKDPVNRHTLEALNGYPVSIPQPPVPEGEGTLTTY